MDFTWTDEETAFRARVRAFIEQELPDDWPEIARHGPGSREQTEFSLRFCPRLAEAGLFVPHWREDWGGEGRSAWDQQILGEEMWAAGEPRGAQYYAVNWLGPVLLRYCTPEQRARWIPPMAGGRTIWCQGFSEPGAGSDLAALRTRAVREGDEYVVNGQKIWTSYAGLAEQCFLLARTGPVDEGKAGIGIFVVPMSAPGIEVRAIPSLIGHGDIHEVFFTDVRIPVTDRIGEEGQAWEIISYALAFERVGIPRYALSTRMLDEMVEELKRRGAFTDPIARARAGEAAAACEAARMLAYKVVDIKNRGESPGTEASMARAAVVAADHAVGDFGMDFLPDAYSGQDHARYLSHHERAIVSGIASGATEIQLDLVARRHLDLPKGA